MFEQLDEWDRRVQFHRNDIILSRLSLKMDRPKVCSSLALGMIVVVVVVVVDLMLMMMIFPSGGVMILGHGCVSMNDLMNFVMMMMNFVNCYGNDDGDDGDDDGVNANANAHVRDHVHDHVHVHVSPYRSLPPSIIHSLNNYENSLFYLKIL